MEIEKESNLNEITQKVIECRPETLPALELDSAGLPENTADSFFKGETDAGAEKFGDDGCDKSAEEIQPISADMEASTEADEKPKRKRAAPRKKAVSSPVEPTASTDTQAADLLEEHTGNRADTTPVSADAKPAAAPKRSSPPGAPVVRRRALAGLDLREMDRGLSVEQRQEWNEIYASYRSKSVLSGSIMGVDRDQFNVINRDTGEEELQRMHTVIVIPYRVKVLIPESEMWMPGEERPGHVLRNMVGSKIDFVVLDLDREGECAIGSRRMALAAKRHFFTSAKSGNKEGDLLNCNVLAVGPKLCLINCNGYDLSLTQRDLTYTAVADLREQYHPGQELACVLKTYNRQEDKLTVSVKEVNPNPFDGADVRHPVNSRRQAVISGKYGGGIFCTLPDGATCLCRYSAQHNDSDFHEGDTVIIVIKQFDYSRELIYGKILARW